MNELVIAVCAGDGRAREAFARWQAQTDLERLAPGEYDLLPLLYHNLVRLEVSSPWMPRLRGVYRRMWYANQAALAAAYGMLGVLEEGGLSPLLVGGAALAVTVYPKPGLRPIGIPGVLVSATRRRAAEEALRTAGWRRSPGMPTLPEGRRQRWQSSQRWVGPEEGTLQATRVQLCWHFPLQALPSGLPAAWTARMEPLAGAWPGARTLAPTDHLRYVLTAAPAAALMPVVDGINLIRNAAIDWSYLATAAAHPACAFVLSQRLRQIRQTGLVEVPDRALAELEKGPFPAYIRQLWRLGQLPAWERTASQRIRLACAGFLQHAAVRGLSPHPGHLYEYLQVHLGADSFGALARKALKRLTMPPPRPHGW